MYISWHLNSSTPFSRQKEGLRGPSCVHMDFQSCLGKMFYQHSIKCLGSACPQIPPDKAVWLLFLHLSLMTTTVSTISSTYQTTSQVGCTQFLWGAFQYHLNLLVLRRYWHFFETAFIQMGSALRCSRLTCYQRWPCQTFSNETGAPFVSFKGCCRSFFSARTEVNLFRSLSCNDQWLHPTLGFFLPLS